MIYNTVIEKLTDKEIVKLLAEHEIYKINALYPKSKNPIKTFIDDYRCLVEYNDVEYYCTPSKHLERTVNLCLFDDPYKIHSLNCEKVKYDLFGLHKNDINDLKVATRDILTMYFLDEFDNEDDKEIFKIEVTNTNINAFIKGDTIINCIVDNNTIIEIDVYTKIDEKKIIQQFIALSNYQRWTV